MNGGRLELTNSVNFRLLMGMLSHELKMWARLHDKGDQKMASAYYSMMIEPGVAVLCYAADRVTRNSEPTHPSLSAQCDTKKAPRDWNREGRISCGPTQWARRCFRLFIWRSGSILHAEQDDLVNDDLGAFFLDALGRLHPWVLRYPST